MGEGETTYSRDVSVWGNSEHSTESFRTGSPWIRNITKFPTEDSIAPLRVHENDEDAALYCKANVQ